MCFLIGVFPSSRMFLLSLTAHTFITQSMWDALLDLRIRLQGLLAAGNQLPQHSAFPLFYHTTSLLDQDSLSAAVSSSSSSSSSFAASAGSKLAGQKRKASNGPSRAEDEEGDDSAPLISGHGTHKLSAAELSSAVHTGYDETVSRLTSLLESLVALKEVWRRLLCCFLFLPK